ncbi:MAG TPA: hydrolase 1, exosortase A system-associated [Burkholderiales bacterium]|nr:hydrolase 1, exosortase A system-associated [Burkholderiales bacterium]
MPQVSERAVSLTCGGNQMLGVLHLPDAGPVRHDIGVLVIVGGPQYRVGSHRQFVLMARHLAGRGYPVFRFDCRGMGDSDGEHRGFANLESDIRCAISAFFDEVPALDRVALFGLCDGASAACIVADRDPRVAALILTNPWVHTETGAAQVLIRHYYLQRLLQRSFWQKLWADGLPLLQKARELVDAGRKAAKRTTGRSSQKDESFVSAMRRGLASFKGETLLLMSQNDLTRQEFDLLCAQSKEWGRLVSGPRVTRVDLFGADHTFSTLGSLSTAAERTVLWLDERALK